MKALFAAAGALAVAAALAPAPAASQARSGTNADRISRVVIYGNDPCPRGTTSGDIVVCARRPETERYRIPEGLRDEGAADDPESTSWAARAESLEYVGRTGIQSCSTVGPGGVSGCWAEMMRAARDERRQSPEGEPGR
jgi:hypothetical protein